VIRPRFADAKFFFVEDMKQGLASMNEGLKTVTYQARLGTVADKVARVAALAEAIAAEVGVDPQQARRAAELSKADLQSAAGQRIPGTAGHRRALLRRRRGRAGRSRQRDRRGLHAALWRRCDRTEQAGTGAGDCRAARHARQRLRIGPEADRQQGSVSRCDAMRWHWRGP
jgi:hypothetical protein